MLLLGMELIFYTEVTVSLFRLKIAGDTWAGIGAVVGWFAAKPEHARVPAEELPSHPSRAS